jgi:ABC-type transport system substrate-binding protein/DNA-binding SARP family transcriptional activator
MAEAEAARADRDYGFGVLGPLRVTRAGVPLSLGGRQQRAVLARLLLADGAGLTVDQLADGLWGEQVPVGAASTIQTYVFHLRQALEPDRGRGAPGRIVVTDNGRYRLAIPPEALDSVVFDLAVDRGERLLADGRSADAITEFDRALALWRGEVLADLADYEFVAPVATRLADRRKAAVEAKIDAELALGRHASVLGQLNELVARDPLNEGLHRQRIIALYRSGRQADALAAYDQLRHQLADELGVDPSPPLQRLHQQVLAHDPALAWHPPPAPQAKGAQPEPESQTQPAAKPPPRRRRPWLRPRWLVVGVILAVVAAAGVVAAVVLANEPKHTLGALPPNSIGILDADGTLHDAVLVGQYPDALVYGFGSLWVANGGERTVQRVNPKTHEVIQTFDVGPNPTAIAISAQNVWVANGADASVTELDVAANKVVATFRVGALPSAVAAGPGVVWVANSGDDNLSRIDIDSGQVHTVPAGDGPDGLLVDGDSLWVANGADGTVSHLDASSGGPVNSARADAGAAGLLHANGSLWVANQSASSVTNIDPQTGLARGTIPVRDGPSSLALAHGAIWASNEYDGTISRIDPSTNRVVRTYAVGASPHGLAVAGGDLWLTSAAFANASHRGGTLTFLSSDARLLNYVDPATAYNIEFGILTRPVYDGLVAYRATGGAAGAAIVPDLAVALPTVTNGGRTYTFTIRSDVRFSNGDLVHASDVRRGLVRELTVGQHGGNPSIYSAIVGAPACISDANKCDTIPGIETDDRARRITFRLSQADPGFLDRLTLNLVVATPKDAPSSESAKPLAGTGPYQISNFVKGQLIELRRNPYFRRWSYAAQPDGYPDVIRYVKPGPSEASRVADVVAGRADVMFSFSDKATNVRLRARYPRQFHEQPWFQTYYLALNVHRPPFDQVGTRRAVNYAFDRRRFADILGGEFAARPACQMLPPGFPGHVSYCPYSDDSFAPNVEVAQSLVKASGTAGMTVDVYGQRYAPQQAQYVASVLRDIGYRPVTHLLTNDNAMYMPFISDPSNKVDVSITPGWIPDYPRPDAYFDYLFSCRPSVQTPWDNNVNRYCRPEVDELVARAKSAQLVDPPEALSLWGQIEHRIMDDAPVVPTANAVIDAFTSRRVGNVQTTPAALPILIGQMWVK